MCGQMKHMKNSAMRRPAGTQNRSVLASFWFFSRRALSRDGSGCAPGASSVVMSGSRAAIPDPWVEYRVHQVGDQVARHGHQGEHHDDALDERQVVDVDGADQLL